MTWYPHATVATVVERNGKFLMVEEFADGKLVFNQPAGHLEPDENILQAAIRETLEETCWQVELEAFLGLYQYTSAVNGICYIRSCFIARAVRELPDRTLDKEIRAVHWLTYQEIKPLGDQLRSQVVLRVIDDYLAGIRYPLSVLTSL